jgi:hypothetical protein
VEQYFRYQLFGGTGSWMTGETFFTPPQPRARYLASLAGAFTIG